MTKITLPQDEELVIEPDTPHMRNLAQAIREGILTIGWEEWVQGFVEATGLNLIKEEDGKRYYERPDGQLTLSVSVVEGEL